MVGAATTKAQRVALSVSAASASHVLVSGSAKSPVQPQSARSVRSLCLGDLGESGDLTHPASAGESRTGAIHIRFLPASRLHRRFPRSLSDTPGTRFPSNNR